MFSLFGHNGVSIRNYKIDNFKTNLKQSCKKIRIRKEYTLSLSIGNKRYKPTKNREMAKAKKNSGKFQQDAIMGQLMREAKGQASQSTAAHQAMQGAAAKAVYQAVRKAEAPVRVSFKFLATGK